MVLSDLQESPSVCWYPRSPNPHPSLRGSLWYVQFSSPARAGKLSFRWVHKINFPDQVDCLTPAGGLEADLGTSPFEGAGVLGTFSCLPNVRAFPSTSPFLSGWGKTCWQTLFLLLLSLSLPASLPFPLGVNLGDLSDCFLPQFGAFYGWL